MKFQVYHAKNPTFTVTSINFSKDFEKVAVVEADNIDDVFRLTNHIDKAWWENEEVKWYKPESRSTSVGDVVVEENGDKYICNLIGWKKI